MVDRLCIQQFRRKRSLDHILENAVPDGVLGDVLIVLGGDDHRVDAPHLVAVEFDGDLGLPVRAQPGQLAVLADLGQLPGQQVAEVDGGGHQLRGVAAGVAEHQALVARAARVHTHGDVGALLVDGHHHRAGGVVETLDVVVVADVLDHLPNQRGHGDVGLGGDLARHQHESGGQERLAGHAAAGIVLQGRVQHGIGNLVRHLVGVPFGDTLGCEQVTPLGGHAGLLGTPPSNDLEGTSSIPRGPLSLYLSDEAGALAMS